jgi:hypothetical protein
MLAIARAKGDREASVDRERVRLVGMDRTASELPQSFRLALIPFRAFQHLTLPDQQRNALNCINRSLVPGGHLIDGFFDRRFERCVPGAPSPIPERTKRPAELLCDGF